MGSLAAHQKATVQRSSSNKSGTPSQRGESAVHTQTRPTPTGSHRPSVHALAMQSAGIAIRPGTGHYVTVPHTSDWYEVGSTRSGHYSGGGYSSSIGNPSLYSARRRMMLPGPNYPPPKSNWSKFKDAFRSFVAWVFSNVGICVLVVGYLILGALTFQQIEQQEEAKIYFRVGEYRKDAVQRLWSITDKYNILEFEKWKNETEIIIKEYQDHVVQEEDKGYDGHDGPPNQWTFSGSLLYSITVITTIGRLCFCRHFISKDIIYKLK